MARFDFFKNQDGAGYLLDVQSDLLSGLNTRVVVPLLPKESAPTPAQRLNPIFNIEGEEFFMATQFMAAISESELHMCIGSLADHQHVISEALDMLFLGF